MGFVMMFAVDKQRGWNWSLCDLMSGYEELGSRNKESLLVVLIAANGLEEMVAVEMNVRCCRERRWIGSCSYWLNEWMLRCMLGMQGFEWPGIGREQNKNRGDSARIGVRRVDSTIQLIWLNDPAHLTQWSKDDGAVMKTVKDNRYLRRPSVWLS